MAIDRKFEAATSKTLRMVNGECDGFGYVPKDIRSVDKIHSLTKIDPWFLCKLYEILL